VYFSSVGAGTARVRRLYFKQNDVVSSIYWGFIIRMAWTNFIVLAITDKWKCRGFRWYFRGVLKWSWICFRRREFYPSTYINSVLHLGLYSHIRCTLSGVIYDVLKIIIKREGAESKPVVDASTVKSCNEVLRVFVTYLSELRCT
jgi:hypothetical protein